MFDFHGLTPSWLHYGACCAGSGIERIGLIGRMGRIGRVVWTIWTRWTAWSRWPCHDKAGRMPAVPMSPRWGFFVGEIFSGDFASLHTPAIIFRPDGTGGIFLI